MNSLILYKWQWVSANESFQQMGSQQHQPIDPQRFTAAASKLDKQSLA